jgi:hypothetical protein
MITEYSVIKSKTLLTTILAVVVVIAIITPPITAVLAQDVFESQEMAVGCRFHRVGLFKMIISCHHSHVVKSLQHYV